MALTLDTPPECEPLDLTEAREFLRLPTSVTAEDTLIDALIPAAREFVERVTGRALITQVWQLTLDQFPARTWFYLPKPPLQSVDSITYRDGDGVVQTWAETSYVVEAPSAPQCPYGRVALAYGETYPTTYGQAGDVTVEFTAGYGDTPGDVPAELRRLLRAAVALAWRYRDVAIPAADQQALERALMGWRVWESPALLLR